MITKRATGTTCRGSYRYRGLGSRTLRITQAMHPELFRLPGYQGTPVIGWMNMHFMDKWGPLFILGKGQAKHCHFTFRTYNIDITGTIDQAVKKTFLYPLRRIDKH